MRRVAGPSIFADDPTVNVAVELVNVFDFWRQSERIGCQIESLFSRIIVFCACTDLKSRYAFDLFLRDVM